MVTQGEVVENVRSMLDEYSEANILESDIYRWINEACKDIARQTETLQSFTDTALVSGTQQYTAPTDTVRIHRVEVIDADDKSWNLEYRDFNNMDSVWWSTQLTVQGRPLIFTTWGFPPSLKIILYPTPDLTGATLRVYYYRLPASLALDGSDINDTLEVPSGWEELVVDFVEYRALRKNRDPRWQEAKALYDEKLNSMYNTTRRWSDQAGMITTPSGGGLPQYIWDENYFD